VFSIPLNPKLNESEFGEFLDFLERNREFVYDFYFTCRMPPFVQDAMGDVFTGGHEDHEHIINTALFVQERTGIKASAVFNNLGVRPTQQNLDLFLLNFSQLYDAGIRSATIPHTHWMATGLIKRRFPELFVKNTILRNVSEPRDIEKLAQAGFDYVNLDRDLMRDKDRLLRFKKAKELFGVKLSLLGNEGCLGGCIMMDEHYEFNNSRTSGPSYFSDPISRVSCPKWDFEDSAVPLKTANLPPWREDWVSFIDELGIDVFKMHGRESVSRLKETMAIVDRFRSGSELLFDTFDDYLRETNLSDRPIDVWRQKIKTCKFDCWDCGYCDKIVQRRFGGQSHDRVKLVVSALVDAAGDDPKIAVKGLTSPRVQALLAKLAKSSDSYLEVGTHAGATALAVAGGSSVRLVCIDTWEENPQPVTGAFQMPKNSMFAARDNLSEYSDRVALIESDFRKVDVSKLPKFDLAFYDGPHDTESVSLFVESFSPCFTEGTILIFDDANWTDVVLGADLGMSKAGLSVLYKKQILNETESPHGWWNGLYVVVLGARLAP